MLMESMPSWAADENAGNMALGAYDYALPHHLIAKYPLDRRDQARMMVLNRSKPDVYEHRCFSDLPDYLQAGDLVVVNNSRVIPSRLIGRRMGHTGKVELLLLAPDAIDPNRWTALMKPKRKLKPGTVIEFSGTDSTAVIETEQVRGQGSVYFHLCGEHSVPALLESAGQMPIPPYLNRAAEEQDKETYQTVYAKIPGSQAAPTAGLHFTPDVLERLNEKGIEVRELTLHVSSGTFRGVYDEDITQHVMDPEYYVLDQSVAEAVMATKQRGNRVIAVGTTAAKTLETVACHFGGMLQPHSDWSRLFIYPGFRFQVVDGLLTNFHLPRTTLIMLVSAFSSREFVLNAYQEAVRNNYRFFSYGDCMLLL